MITTYGVVLKIHISESRLHALTLTYTGEIWPHLLGDITFTIPNFVPLDLTSRVGSGYSAANTVETAARLETVEKVRVFARQHEREYNSLSKTFHKLYDQVRHPDPEKWAEITTVDAARVVDLRRPPPVLTLFALHSYMMSRPNYFVADPLNHRSSQRFSIRPLAQVQRLEQVNQWTHPPGHEFKSFLTNARDAVVRILGAKAKINDESPRMTDLHLKPWSETDMVFIRYLRDSLRSTRSIQTDPYRVAAVMKNLNIYKERISSAMIQQFLTDIGYIAPWQDVIMDDPQLDSDSPLKGNSARTNVINDLIRYNLENPGVEAPVAFKKQLRTLHLTGSSQLYPEDRHASVRHDFGSLPVYVIDDEGAQELDDAISIERIPDEPSTYWVHVHIADPTVSLPPGHVADICAQKLAQTRYAVHQTWPMLPDALTSKFSLGSLPEGTPQPVLSYSLKVSEDGSFLDYKIRAGLVRNIQILQYNQVDRALGLDTSVKFYPFDSISPKTYPPVLDHHLSDLRILRNLAHNITVRNVREKNLFLFSVPRAEVTFNEKLVETVTPDRPILWTGYPSMTYTVHRGSTDMLGTRNTVAQFMILACRASSRFCIDNGIPAIRRSCPPPPLTDEVLSDILDLRNEYGVVDAIECVKRDVFLYPSEATLEPKAHASLGVPEGEGYCRTTSPLRRYTDLLMHWQIKHALLPASQRSSSNALFPAETLRTFSWQLHDKEITVGKMQKLYNKYWTSTYLHRHITKSREVHGDNYDPFPGLIARSIGHNSYDSVNSATQIPVIIDHLGVQGMLRGLPKSVDQVPIGTPFNVKISEITLGLAPFLVVNTI